MNEGDGTTPAARQRAVDALCEAFARDELELVEFERRVETAHRATSADELDALLRDLPSVPPPVPAGNAGRTARRPPVSPLERVRERDVIVGILGGASRRGRWYPARKTLAVGIMGGVQLDLREAPLPPGVTEIQALGIWGGIEIIVPPGVRVDCSGIGIMGGFDERYGEPATDDPEAPVVRVTGFALMGGVQVEAREPGESSRDARRRWKEAVRGVRARRSRIRRRLGRGEDPDWKDDR